MKVRASVKKRSPECKIVRTGILYVINKRTTLNKDKILARIAGDILKTE
jgi:ribosomal protein L36